MSCHFHLLRRRKAAQKAAEVKAAEEVKAKPEAAQKAAKSRKKGDA